MEPMTLRICHLYPTLLRFPGDRGNVMAIQRRCEWRGLRVVLREIALGERVDLTGFDVILMHGNQDQDQEEMALAARDLTTRAPNLREAVEEDVVVLAVCAGYQLLGRQYQPPEGEPIAGVGILNMQTERDENHFAQFAAVTCDFARGGEKILVGYENHSGHTYLNQGTQPLGHVVAGNGNNGTDGGEGARYRQVYGTYLHGPLLPLNPWFADHLIWRGLRHRYDEVAPLPQLADGVEERAHEAMKALALLRAKGKLETTETTDWTH